MNKLQNLVCTGLMGLVAAGTGACMSDEAEPATSGPIATLSLADGTELEIHEIAPGQLLVAASGVLPPEVEALRPLDMYEALSGGAAPGVLVEAQARADLALAARPPSTQPPVRDEVTAPARAEIASLTATDFQSAWCNPGTVDFDYCWTNRTNNYSIDVSSASWIHAHSNACSGQFTLSVSKKTLFGWNLVYSDTVLGSSYVSTYSTTDNDTYRVEVLQASGDCWHLAIHGDK